MPRDTIDKILLDWASMHASSRDAARRLAYEVDYHRYNLLPLTVSGRGLEYLSALLRELATGIEHDRSSNTNKDKKSSEGC